jgi:hypothetical protein
MPDWVLKAGMVRQCMGILRAQSIHPFFPAYLHIRRTAAAEGSRVGIRPIWEELGRLLEVAGAPSTHPYFRPFTTASGESDQEWLNPNIAGSYAPSSLRAGQPPLQVVEVGAGRGRFNLREMHWELARVHLLDGKKVPLTPLAAFFLRDFAFENYDAVPTDDDLRRGFIEMFGYNDDEDGPREVAHLYDVSIQAGEDWFEEWKNG